MQEIFLKAFAIVGACSLFLLVVWVFIRAKNFFNDLECFRSETKYSLKWLEKDLHKLSERKGRIYEITAEHQDSVNKQIKEENEKQDKFYLQMFDELREQRFDDMKSIDKMESRITDRIKNLETTAKQLETRIEVMEAILEEIINGKKD